MSKKCVVIVPGFWEIRQASMWSSRTLKGGVTTTPKKSTTEVNKLVQDGCEVTVVMHSAGGFIALEGLKGLLAPDLVKAGKTGGVTGLLYITAPCMSIGEEAPPAPWSLYEGDYLWAKDPRGTLYSDLPDPEADIWTKRLKHHPAHNYNSKTSQEPWKYVPSVYLKCANDGTIPLELQSTFAAKIPGCDIETCNSGHSPFLSQPKKVVEAIIKAAKKSNKDNGA